MVQQKVRIIDIIIDYGRPTAAKMVKKAVEGTIKQTRMDMYQKRYRVMHRDLIPGRLENSHLNSRLYKKNSNGKYADTFCGREILAMRRTMPAFDFYFTVKEVK